MEITLASDIVIATKNSIFGLPEGMYTLAQVVVGIVLPDQFEAVFQFVLVLPVHEFFKVIAAALVSAETLHNPDAACSLYR